MLNIPINLGKVTSSLKNYFNQNKEYKTPNIKTIEFFLNLPMLKFAQTV